MFSKTALVAVAPRTQVRGMATLKEIRLRLKSVTNIQKITKSMKMVSAAKYAKAERELKPARNFGVSVQEFYDKSQMDAEGTKPNKLVVAMTSDRGLCGAVHTSICKAIKAAVADEKGSDTKLVLIGDKSKSIFQRGLCGAVHTSICKAIKAAVADEKGSDTKLVLIGDKSKSIFQRTYGDNIVLSFNNIGKKPPSFQDAGFLAESIQSMGVSFDIGNLYYNVFKSVISYKTTILPFFTEEKLRQAPNLNVYDSVDDDTLQSYNEFLMVSSMYYCLKEAACSEQSSRMTAMDAASKNAGEMIDKLTLTFNRTRQAVITRELIEIISGAAAL